MVGSAKSLLTALSSLLGTGGTSRQEAFKIELGVRSVSYRISLYVTWLVVCFLGCLVALVFGCLRTWVLKCLGPWVPGYLGAWVP